MYCIPIATVPLMRRAAAFVGTDSMQKMSICTPCGKSVSMVWRLALTVFFLYTAVIMLSSGYFDAGEVISYLSPSVRSKISKKRLRSGRGISRSTSSSQGMKP